LQSGLNTGVVALFPNHFEMPSLQVLNEDRHILGPKKSPCSFAKARGEPFSLFLSFDPRIFLPYGFSYPGISSKVHLRSEECKEKQQQ